MAMEGKQLIRTYSNNTVEINLWYDVAKAQYILEVKDKAGGTETTYFTNKRDASKAFTWRKRRYEKS